MTSLVLTMAGSITEENLPEIILEEIRAKVGVVLKGIEILRQEIRDMRQELSEKISLVDFKIDAVADDLKAHRADTEAHRPIYRVKE
jgi:hypothetical protein